jgi:hypothetical protein
MEEVCDFIAKYWNVEFGGTQYIEQSSDDDLKKVNSNDSTVEYIITQLNITFGDEISEIVSDEESSSVSFKYKELGFTVEERYHSRGYGYWVINIF